MIKSEDIIEKLEKGLMDFSSDRKTQSVGKVEKNTDEIIVASGLYKAQMGEKVLFDDGSVGIKGRVSLLFDKIIKDPQQAFIYTCGPNPMMKAVQAFAEEHNLSGQAACEEIMACALGACLGCSIETTKGFKTVCYDGPAFNLHEVKFH